MLTEPLNLTVRILFPVLLNPMFPVLFRSDPVLFRPEPVSFHPDSV
jgi:hypothetical protein